MKAIQEVRRWQKAEGRQWKAEGRRSRAEKRMHKASRQMARDGSRRSRGQQRAKQRSSTCEHTQVSGAKRRSYPQGHTEGREWRAEGRGHAFGTQQAARVQQIATDNTRGHRT